MTDPLSRIHAIRDARTLDAAVADLARPAWPAPGRPARHPYVGEGSDGARRSAEIDREEADGLDRDDPRYGLLLTSAAEWDAQAREEEAR